MAFGFGDTVAAFTIAQRVYSIGFSKATNATRQYREFGEDVRSLTNNLYVLEEVLNRARKQSQSTTILRNFNGLSNLSDILGDFRQTLNDCEKLLTEKSCFQKRDGFVNNVIWNTGVADDILVLRERVRFHNIKLSTALSTLEVHVVHDLHYRMQDALSQILNRIDELGRQISNEDIEVVDELPKTPLPFTVPSEVADAFAEVAQQRYPDLSTLRLTHGLDSVVYYMDVVTKTPSNSKYKEIGHLSSTLSLMKACWLIQAIKACNEYKAACKYQSDDAIEIKMMTWGMTVDKFVEKLEKDLAIACHKISGRLPEPPEPLEIISVFNREKTIWSDEALRRKELQPDKTKLGDEVVVAELHSADPDVKQLLRVFRQKDNFMTLLVSNIDSSGGNSKEMCETEVVGLLRAHLVPTYALKQSKINRYVVKFKADEKSPLLRILSFKEPQDMLKFQLAITGYKVVHDVPELTLTHHQSKVFLGGLSSTRIGRLQIWNAPWAHVSRAAQSSPSIGKATSLFSLQTNSEQTNRKRFSQAWHMMSPQPAVPDAGSSSVASGRLPASISSGSELTDEGVSETMSQQSSQSVESDGIIFSPPTPPCLVFFAVEENSSRSFLVIELDGLTVLNKELCDCFDQRQKCLKVVIERQGSSILVSKSKDVMDPNDWNIAHAGKYQRQDTLELVKRMKSIVLEFESVQERSMFEQKFEQVTRLARIRWNEYVAIT